MSSSPDPRSPARGRDTARESAPPANARVAPAHDRVVIHLDLDAFYAQVETKRLGLDPAQPLAVQQWQGIIAVNYPARDGGIRRHHTAAEARRLCPTIALVHVETIGDEEDVDREDESDVGGGGGGTGDPTVEDETADAAPAGRRARSIVSESVSAAIPPRVVENHVDARGRVRDGGARVHRRGVPRRDRRGGRGAPRRPGGYRGARVRLGVDASGAPWRPSTPTRARSTVDWRSARTCVAARARRCSPRPGSR